MNSIVFDLGGTHLRVARTNGRKLLTPRRELAPRTYPSFLRSIRILAARLSSDEKLAAAACGVAGQLDRQKTRLLGSPHLRFLIRRPLQHDLQRLLRVPVSLENDNALAGLGEATYGAGKGCRIVAYIGIGTGIGGSRIVDGRIDVNAFGFEPGHHYIDYRVLRHAQASPHPGDWESIVSGSAFLIHHGKRAERVKDQRVWNEMAFRTAIGLVNITMFWSPEVIVLGGSFMKSVSLREVRLQYHRKQKIFFRSPVLRRSMLGDFGGLYGAMELLRQQRHEQ